MTSNETIAQPNLGEIYTRRWVVDWMLDISGYTPTADLAAVTVVEPSCGTGAFLLPIAERLLDSAEQRGLPFESLAESIWATDLNPTSAALARERIRELLDTRGVPAADADDLSRSWVRPGDFLIDAAPQADLVIGNPPYVRLEEIDADLLSTYRTLWQTMKGRADLYVGFIEKGLGLLNHGGTLSFICADRWMRNGYGKALRELIADRYSIKSLVRLHDVDCFESDVSAYPSITTIENCSQGSVAVINTNAQFSATDVPSLNDVLFGSRPSVRIESAEAIRIEQWFDTGPYPEGTLEEIELLGQLERDFAPLEDVLRLTRVGIGVATGSDEIYITEDPELVEPERLLPLAMAKHITDGTLRWTPTYLVNPWDDQGLVQLDDYPRFAAYLESRGSTLRDRHTAKRAPEKWHRTIDRVNHWLTNRPKIFLADMKSRITPVVDTGGLYPHHNLYWITSDRWDIEALAGLLLSDHANLFISAYCVKMRGGTLRFQAQYLRRIRLPEYEDLTLSQIEALRRANRERDIHLANEVAEHTYGHALGVNL